MKIFRCQKGFGLAELLIAFVILVLLYIMKVNHAPNSASTAPKASDYYSAGYIQQRVAVGQQAKNDVKNIEKMLQDRYK